eukprot:9481527-Pyramimonas_sp.AAC.1
MSPTCRATSSECNLLYLARVGQGPREQVRGRQLLEDLLGGVMGSAEMSLEPPSLGDRRREGELGEISAENVAHVQS